MFVNFVSILCQFGKFLIIIVVFEVFEHNCRFELINFVSGTILLMKYSSSSEMPPIKVSTKPVVSNGWLRTLFACSRTFVRVRCSQILFGSWWGVNAPGERFSVG